MNKFRKELEIRERIISEMKTKPKETQGWINTICYALREAEDKKEKKFSKINRDLKRLVRKWQILRISEGDPALEETIRAFVEKAGEEIRRQKRYCKLYSRELPWN